MNIFKRALINLKENIGKTILIFLIFFISMFAITAKNVVDKSYEKILAAAFPDGDVPVYMYARPSNDYESDEMTTITTEMYQKIGQLDTVTKVEANHLADVSTRSIDLLTEEMWGLQLEFRPDLEMYNTEGYTLDYSEAKFNSEEFPVVINDELMELNGFKVGDKFPITLPGGYLSYGMGTEDSAIEDLEFTIVGTYSVEPTPEMLEMEMESLYGEDYEAVVTTDTMISPDFSYLKGYLITNLNAYDSVAEIIDGQVAAIDNYIYSDFTMYIESVEKLALFQNQAEEIAGIGIDVNVAYFEEVDELSTVIDAKYYISQMFKFSMVLIIILLVIITSIFVRGRRKEIGVLIALGERRVKIFLQLVIEYSMLATLATLVCYPVVYQVLAVASLPYSDEKLNLPFLILPLGISLLYGVLIVIIATLVPVVYIMRLNPKKILL